MKVKHGGWASKLTPEERSKRMRALALHKHSKLSKEDHLAHSRMMLMARKKKKQVV